jgi:uncharacterized membrane protein YkvA (DUF1232 family)
MSWLEAALVGLLVVVVLAIALAVTARMLPPGPAKELVGFLPNCVVLLRRVRKDRRLPRRGRMALAGAAAYLASPIQVIPNFIPVIGQTDDVIVVVAALRYACRRLPRASVEAAWPGDPAYLDRLLGHASGEAEDR